LVIGIIIERLAKIPEMKIRVLLVFSFAILTIMTGCRRNGDNLATRLLSNVSGASGEVVIVANNEILESPEGKRLQDMFQSPVPAMPQYEPMFNLITVTPSGFGKLFQNHRNVLFVNVDPSLTETKIVFQTDTYAASQLVFKATGPDARSVIDELEKRRQQVFDKILTAERERLMRYYMRTQASHTFNRLRDQHGISMPVPSGYQIDVTKQGFAWVANETPTTSQSVLLHYFKASGSSVFSRDSMIMIRNRLTMEEVKGPVAGTYMGIEERYPVEYRVFNHNGRNYAEIRGLWTLINGFMGGPFISVMTYDEKNRRAVFLDGFVYAPNENKRELMRQVEALIYLADFHSAEEVVVIGKKPAEEGEGSRTLRKR
jgi:hypothetical protein